MKICQISDTHFGSESDFNRKLLYSLLDRINNSGFSLLIHSGDVTQSGRKDEYIEARRFFKKIKIPHIVIPGNHDARNGGLKLFEDHIGPVNGYKEIDDGIIIYVNSAIADSDEGRVGMVKFDLIKDILQKYTDAGLKVVLIHHHIIPIPMAGRERNVLSNAGDILDLLIKGDVDLVLSGHRHYPNVHKVENTLFVNAGTTSSVKTRYGDVNSYNVIEIGDREQSFTTVRVDGRKSERKYSRKRNRVFYDFGSKIFRVAHLSNTFISNDRSFLRKHFKNAIMTINRLEPDLIVHCGGIVREGITQDYELAVRLFSTVDGPILFTPAGRDLNYLGYHLFPKYMDSFDQKYKTEDVVFQGVSSSQYDSPVGIVGDTQRKALFKKLHESSEGIKAIFLHHNLIPIPHSREKGLLEDSGDLLREVVDAEIDLVLTGTSSHPYAAKVGKTVIVNANSTSSVYQRSVMGNSFNLIDIYEDALAVYEVNSLWGSRRLLGIWNRNG